MATPTYNKTSLKDSSSHQSAVEQTTKPLSRFTKWYRIWNALNNTGAVGQQEPYLINGANSSTFGIIVFSYSLFRILSNKIGIKTVLIIGTLGYASYSASLYVNNRYGTEWFVLYGGTTCRLAASALWASEGAIALGYAGVKDRGKSVSPPSPVSVTPRLTDICGFGPGWRGGPPNKGQRFVISVVLRGRGRGVSR